MGFYKVPIYGGVLDIDYLYMIEGKTIAIDNNGNGLAVVYMRDEAEVRNSWEQLTLEEYLSFYGAAILESNKETIISNGIDAAIITAQSVGNIAEVTFYHTDTGELIATVPVDPEAHTATLQVTATTPGIIRIRAGEPIATKLNEVLINASA